jgi:hypothetical protein
MITETFKNWVSKADECGFTLEQTCGMAMLYAWALTYRSSEDEIPDTESFWTFVDQQEFNQLNEVAFNMQDFLAIAPEFQMAAEMLKVDMPSERYAENGELTTFFNTDWQNEFKDEKHVNEVLLLRNRFDLMWCQRLGECLRPEVRTPLHAFVFTNNITHTFVKIDPIGFTVVLNALLSNKSPLLSIFTSKKLVKESQGLKGYEPFQIALMGFTSGLDPHLGESLWGLQKALFYKQPSGIPINLEKQSLAMHQFLEFAVPVIENFININRSSYLDLTRFIANEYIYASISESQFTDQLTQILQSRYGFNFLLQEENKPQDFLMNAAAFYTTCCLKIKNMTNQIAKQPSLKMLDDRGLIWYRDVPEEVSIQHEAIICFDVMLSWRLGPALGLFIKTHENIVHRFYVGEFATNEEIESLLCEICNAYRIKECVLAFQMDNFPLRDDKPDKKFKAAFLSLANNQATFIDLYRCDVGLQEGFFLDDYVGQITDEKIIMHLFKNLQICVAAQPDANERKRVQKKLIQVHGSASAWSFSYA